MEQMSPIYRTVNGVSSVTNGQCVLINETQNVVYPDTTLSPISITSSVIEVHDIIDTDAVRARARRRKSIVSLSDINLKPSKLVFVIGLCLVIGLSLPSVIFYYVPVSTQSHDDDLYNSVNFSMVNLLACLFWLMI